MAISDAQKRANQRWDAKNMKHYGVKMANREAIAFDRACAAEGVTPHSVFLRAAREMIAAHEKPPAPETAGPTETREPDSDADG